MSSLIGFQYYPSAELNHPCLSGDDFSPYYWTSAPSLKTTRCAASQRLACFHPRLDLSESKDSNTVTATFELPGLKSEDVTIDLHQNRLTVSGESSTSNSVEEEGYAVRERRHGKFSRTLQLPLGTKPEDVKAEMENGLLTLTFPKAIEQHPQRIAIH